MLEKTKLEIVSRETIKPSSPTPPHLRNLDLSFIDVHMPPIYTGALFFYRNNGDNGVPNDVDDISCKLKKSLSETLTRFYPLAGRVKGNAVDCNDEGAIFVEAQVGFKLSDLLENPNPQSLIVFIPDNGEIKAREWPLLNVQVTNFDCGGFILGICLRHILTDAKTFSMFMRGWSAAANGRGDSVKPDFMAASRVFPLLDGQEPVERPEDEEKNGQEPFVKPEYVTKRFVFEAEKIKKLRNMAESETPTRFEAILALLWRCVARIARRNNGGVTRPSALIIALDLRRRNVSPLLSENSVGNIISAFYTEIEDGGENMGHGELVKKLKEDKKKTEEKLVKTEPVKSAEEYIKTLGEYFHKKFSGAIDGHICTSWDRLGFYEADLGFGKPIWVAPNTLNWEVETLLFLDARNEEGTEVWVTLKVEDMAAMEEDDELLQFATLNPTVVA